MKPLVKSVLQLLSISLLVGAAFLLIKFTVLAFVAGLLIGLVVQLIVGWVIGEWRDTQLRKFEYQGRLDEQAILRANSIAVDCAACKTPHSIPIIVSERNTFKCRKCEVENVIMFTATTAQTTKLDE